MNEQLQTKLVEILGNIQSATKAAGDFALEQLPEIAQQYLLYGRVSITFTVLLCFLITIACTWGLLYCVKKLDSCNYGGEAKYGFGMVLHGVGVSGAATIGLCELSSLFLVWFAPKVWLIKEIATLIK